MTAPASLLATLVIGFVLGLRHALDTDHVVAVSTLVARERSVWKSTLVGAIWGLGHTATLLVMGILIIVLGLEISANVAHWLEISVAAMLIFLGARTLWQWKQGHTRTHFHPKSGHFCTDETHAPQQRDGARSDGAHRQSFLVGMVHGLSGSAELMLLVLATIRHPLWALTYVAIFGLGMICAMFALTTLFSFALGLTNKFRRGGWNQIDGGLRALTGAASLGFGSYLLWNSALIGR